MSETRVMVRFWCDDGVVDEVYMSAPLLAALETDEGIRIRGKFYKIEGRLFLMEEFEEPYDPTERVKHSTVEKVVVVLEEVNSNEHVLLEALAR